MTASEKMSARSARTSKIEQVLALLGREQGATLTEITELSGWLPHTARAALTGLRQLSNVLRSPMARA